MKEKTTNKKLLIIIGCALAAAAVAAIVLLRIFVFNDTPGTQFKNIKSSDIESITGKMYTEGSTGEIKGDDIDEFIKLMRDADYKRSDRSDHYASVIFFEVKFKDGKEQQISVVGSYGSSDDNDSGELTLYKGFVKIDDGDYYECDTKELKNLFLKNSNSKYKEKS
jgi:uncharacterized protein YcbK (DUF882 family)